MTSELNGKAPSLPGAATLSSLILTAVVGGQLSSLPWSDRLTTTDSGLDREGYLRHVLSRTAEYPVNCIEEILPWNIAASLPSVAPTTA